MDSSLPFEMKSAFMVCAALGGLVLLVQMVMLVFGHGGDTDFDHDAEVDLDHDDGSLGLLSIRAIAGFLAFFGLTGLYGEAEGWNPPLTLGAAVIAGFVTMYGVAWLMKQFKKLSSEGNLDPRNAVGKDALVYLRIPGERSGRGKITVLVQGRSLQFEAITSGSALPTGAPVRVKSLVSDGLFEVVAAGESAASSPA